MDNPAPVLRIEAVRYSSPPCLSFAAGCLADLDLRHQALSALSGHGGWVGDGPNADHSREPGGYMISSDYDAVAAAIAGRLPSGRRVAVIGSTQFWGSDSEEVCTAVGTRLAEIDEAVLLTGGVPGVGETVGRSFSERRQTLGRIARIFHVLPEGSDPWDYGVTLAAGADMEERREILGRLPAVFVAIEGGPGTAHEAAVALSRGAVVIAVGRTGGHSESAYSSLGCPRAELLEDWKKLNDKAAAIDEIATAVSRMVLRLTSPSGGEP